MKLNDWQEFDSARVGVSRDVWNARQAVPGGWVYVYGQQTRVIDHAVYVPDPSAPHVAGADMHLDRDLARDLRTMTAIAIERGKRINEALSALLLTRSYPRDVPSAIRSLQCAGPAESAAGAKFVTALAAELGEDVQ